MTPTFEHRKLYRTYIICKVQYKTTEEPLLEGIALSKNLSSTGLNIIMSDKLEKDAELELKIHISDTQDPIIAKGKVLWQDPCPFVPESRKRYYLTGLRLCDMTPENAIRESDFVKRTLIRKSEEQDRRIVGELEGMG